MNTRGSALIIIITMSFFICLLGIVVLKTATRWNTLVIEGYKAQAEYRLLESIVRYSIQAFPEIFTTSQRSDQEARQSSHTLVINDQTYMLSTMSEKTGGVWICVSVGKEQKGARMIKALVAKRDKKVYISAFHRA